jgi:pilus assembly protein Flp/PilA
MNILNASKNLVIDFAREEDGAQVVEYGLVIAIVSIALALGLKVIAGGTPFQALATRIGTCLSGTGTCA